MRKNKKRQKIFLLNIRWKTVLSFGVCLIMLSVISFAYYHVSYKSTSKTNGIIIVLDAGHGARDGGSIGTLGTIEKDINLKYTLELKDKLVKSGYIVELTRKTDDALYLLDAKNKKQSDMQARMRIIKKANPNLVISIHMNSFSDKSVKGANTFYRKGDASGEQIANLVQKSLNKYCYAKNTLGKIGDYYILNESYYTSILIECGFLSNIEEERMLNTEEYLETFTSAVCSGIMLYFGFGGTI